MIKIELNKRELFDTIKGVERHRISAKDAYDAILCFECK
jgi:hypothetical protein